MTDTARDAYLASAIHAAHEAARIQLGHLGGDLHIDTKSSDIDLVTQVDRMCEARIREILLEDYPTHVVLGEEQGQQGESRHRWIVDPLDGTVNYAHAFPFFCTSIALEIDGTVEVGVVYDAVRDELFTATAGGGARLNGRPLHVTPETELRRALVATGFAYVEPTQHRNVEVFTRMLPEVQAVRRPGAAALDLSYVAAGRVDAFWELELNPWDVAAGILLIREAGGTVTNGDGAPFRFGDAALVASNGHLHGRLLALLDLGRPRA